LATARCLRAQAHLAFGNPVAACEDLQQALPDLEQMRAVGECYLVEALAGSGHLEEATALLQPYEEEAAWPSSVSRLTLLGYASTFVDTPAVWTRCYQALCAEPTPLVLVYSPISVQRVLGRLASRLHLWTDAVRHFEIARDQFKVAGAEWELAQICLDYAAMRRSRSRKGDKQKAAALEAEARSLLQPLGLEHVLQGELCDAPSRDVHGLSAREMEVMELVARGQRNPEIAEALSISGRTVERHLENIFAKMGVRNRTEAVVEAARVGLLSELQ
jgi:ATP/maltotriose-dependent transcriptional regulator MalT